MATVVVNDSPAFPVWERPAILALLEEFTNALAIYHSTLEKPGKHDNDIFLDGLPNDTDDLEMFDHVQIAEIDETRRRAISAKIYENSSHVRTIMEELKEEIRSRGTFQVLAREIERTVSREKEEMDLLAERETLGREATKLQKLLEEERAANEREKRRILRELAEEQRQLEKLKATAATELKYVSDWGEAWREQHSLRRDKKIEKLEKVLNDLRLRERNEHRVHAGLVKFLTDDTASLEKKTREWEERYVRDKRMYENEIRRLRIEMETRRKELDELKEEYDRNQQFIDMYTAEKEARRKKKEQRERMQKSAIKIQAWWRGVMVRRKLGPYRPAEKRKRRQTRRKK